MQHTFVAGNGVKRQVLPEQGARLRGNRKQMVQFPFFLPRQIAVDVLRYTQFKVHYSLYFRYWLNALRSVFRARLRRIRAAS